MQIINQKEEMKAAATDPNRLLGKGKGAGSRLLQEEKLRVRPQCTSIGLASLIRERGTWWGLMGN